VHACVADDAALVALAEPARLAVRWPAGTGLAHPAMVTGWNGSGSSGDGDREAVGAHVRDRRFSVVHDRHPGEFIYPIGVSAGMCPRNVNSMLLCAPIAVAEQLMRRHGSFGRAGVSR
jgi:hypothetical protein